MKIRTDFVTNSSSSGFVVINVESKVLQKLFEEAGVPYSLFESFKDIYGTESGIPGSITDSVALTVCGILSVVLEFENICNIEGCEELSREKLTSLISTIRQHGDEIDSDAVAVIESGVASSDSGGPDISYARLEMENGKGHFKNFSAYDDYYGDDENPSMIYKWAKEHGYYDSSFRDGYDDDLYFCPPYEELAESYEGVTKVDIDAPLSERKKCYKYTFVVSGKFRIFGSKLALEKYIVSQGGQKASKLSSSVDYLIANDSTSKNVQAAKDLGIQILTEDEFVSKFGKE